MNNENGFWNKTSFILGIIASICTIGGFSVFNNFSIFDSFKAKFKNQEAESSHIYETTKTLFNIETTAPKTNEETTSATETTSVKETAEEVETTTIAETTEEAETTTIQTQPQTEPISPIEPTYAPAYTVGWLEDEAGNWKWVNKDGSFQYSGWLRYKGDEYYFENELMVTDWQQIDERWYYFNENGAMQKNTWVGDYYLQSDGKMVTGWQQIDGSWYYFNESGIMQMNTWIDDYYLGSNGIMLINTTINIDGINYYFDTNGFANSNKNGVVDYPGQYKTPSILAFSDDCHTVIDSQYDEFYFVGNVSSNYDITNITYEYCTPNTFYEQPYTGYIDENFISGKVFDLSTLEHIINGIESNYEGFGDYQLTIFAEDSSGNRDSITLNWQY